MAPRSRRSRTCSGTSPPTGSAGRSRSATSVSASYGGRRSHRRRPANSAWGSIPSMDLVIRRARPSDKRDVLAAVRTIWGGQDRIPDVFDRWVTHRTGPFFVAESGGRVVGMGKLTVVSPTEAWLEGGRVAPRWRRKGIATALIAHRVAYARDRGIRLLRFSTASDNTPIHRAARHFGFTRAGALSRREAPGMPGAPPTRATPAQERAGLRCVGPLVQLGPGWGGPGVTPRAIRQPI